MPIPKPTPKQDDQDFISKCVREISGEYPAQQALAICYQQLKLKSQSKP